jgi:hypothetical protein
LDVFPRPGLPLKKAAEEDMPSNNDTGKPATTGRMTRRSMIGSLSAASVSTVQTNASLRREPNFLFILADDHAGYVLGCNGNSLATTPNMDRGCGGYAV